MTSRLFSAVGLCLLISSPALADELKSGPPVGASVGSFYPTNLQNVDNPKKNGTEACLV